MAPRETTASREAGKFGLPDGVKTFQLVLGFHVGGGGVTPFIPGVLLVSADITQLIPQMRFMVTADLS
jgi:hypothetical protein